MTYSTMALSDKFGYESIVNEVPPIPHVPRSARGKRSIRKKVEENQMSAFDMLATVAGKLLFDSECPLDLHHDETRMETTPLTRETVKGEQSHKKNSLELESCDQHNLTGKTSGCEVISEKKTSRDVKELPFVTNSIKPGSDSHITEPSKSHFIATAKESSNVYNKCEIPLATDKCETWNKSSIFRESQESKEDLDSTNANKPKTCRMDDPMDLDTKPSALLSSDSSAKVPFYKSTSQQTSCPRYEDGMKPVVDRGDDERSSGCTHSSSISYKDTKLQRIGGDCRIRKIVASKHWKEEPKMLNNGDVSKRDVDLKPTINGKKLCYPNQKTHKDSFKKRKLFENSSLSTSRERAFSESLSNLRHKESNVKLEGRSAHARESLPSEIAKSNGASSATSGHKISYEKLDCHVKLSIRSFKVPELFIEIPETATVASLKRTVMETVAAILGGGLRVGVLLEGKKVRDDNKTLRQAGILQSDKLDNIGFTLEPNPTEASAPLTGPEHPSFLGISDAAETQPRTSLNNYPLDEQVAADSTPLALTSCPESDDSSHSPAETTVPDKTMANSRVLVPVLPLKAEPLAIVPLRKPKRSEVVQRRIRRPFTVAEVEALVQAVEKLGTGRWRDVKQRAFDNAKHRTYVDLKDKWKTLVHTARISPQQRRGEPVPQDLLDRVLSAHAYWSQQQAKPSQLPDLLSLPQQSFQ